MKSEEKALELVSKMCLLDCRDKNIIIAKQCALICVDEMLEFAYDIEWEKKEEAISKLKFLKEVKQEINKL
jgi:hypothetical protein